MIKLKLGKKIYFASDFHLGAPTHTDSLVREKLIVKWLDDILIDAQVIFLVGDLFDFWFEYKQVVPKGFVRLLGKLADLSDRGIEIKIFTGNHDLWMSDYFQKEIGAEVFHNPQVFNFSERTFYIGHGDGLGPGDYGYKWLKKLLFMNPVCRFLFGRLLHPNLGMLLGNLWSRNSWKKHRELDDVYHFESTDKEFLFQYCQSMEDRGEHHDYYVFGHRHYVLDLPLKNGARYLNLGDWTHFNSYAVFDGEELLLQRYD